MWPFPEKQLREKCAQVKRLIVVEHNHGQMLLQVQRAAADTQRVDFLGRIDGTVITPDEIVAAFEGKEDMTHAQ